MLQSRAWEAAKERAVVCFLKVAAVLYLEYSLWLKRCPSQCQLGRPRMADRFQLPGCLEPKFEEGAKPLRAQEMTLRVTSTVCHGTGARRVALTVN